MLYKIARFLQLAGMTVPILGLAGNMADKNSVTAMYQFLMVGIGLFVAGYWLQQAAGKK